MPELVESKAVEIRTGFSEIPVLICCREAANFAAWRERLGGMGVLSFCTSNLAECMAVLAECDQVGTPVGLLVYESPRWDAEAAEALRCFREWRCGIEVPVFVSLTGIQAGELLEGELLAGQLLQGQLAAMEAAADYCFCGFEGNANEAVFRSLARQRLTASARIRKLRQEREQAVQQLREERQAAMVQDLWCLDLASRELHFPGNSSGNAHELSGFATPEMGMGLDDWLGLIHPEDLARLSLALGAVERASIPDEMSFEFRLKHQSGQWRWLLLRARLEMDEQGSPLRVIGTHTDITRSKTTDSVTGLPNRFSFEEDLSAVLESAAWNPAVFVLGIDRHQMLRDSLGQDLGDALLRTVAERLQSALGEPARSLLARLGGDEFVIALEGISNASDASAAATRLEQALQRPLWLDGREIHISISQGIALWCPAEDWKSFRGLELGLTEVGGGVEQARELWRGAEIALHNAQKAGGGRSVFFDEAMRADVVDRMQLESEMKRAIERWEFEVYYQPKVSLCRERIIGFEALIRWRHPVRGIIPPSVFIPLAEENGLIIPLGLRTIRESCEALARWQKEFPRTPALEVSVNLSVRQFQDQQLLGEIRRVLESTGIPPSTLLFEVTESVLVDDPVSALEIVQELRHLGVGLKIDDFGTGYSSLSYLHRLPFDTLKIDKSFIATMGQDHSAFEIVKAIISLARNLGLQVVAEGVETRNQADELREMGCEYAQGYLYAPPLTVDAAWKMLDAQRVFEAQRVLEANNLPPGQTWNELPGASRGMF